MNINILFQIAGIGILTVIISQILNHSGKSEIATLATLAGVIMVLVMVLNMVSDLFSSVKVMFGL